MDAILLRCFFAAALLLWPLDAKGQQPATKVMNDAEALSEAKPILASALLQLRASKSRLILFDVRGRDEYLVSHLAGALHVDPLREAQTVAARVKRRANGAVVVFYCTIGGRSAILAEAAAPTLKAHGATGVFILTNEIIGWANAGYPLVDRFGATKLVHPFNQDMSKALKESNLASYEPRSRK